MRIIAFVAMWIMAFSTVAVAQTHRCADAVAAKMTQLNVPPAQIVRTTFVNVTDGGCCEQLIGYEAWVDLKQCRGSVVLKLSLQCGIEEAYSRGACDIPGLKNYR